MFGFLQYIDIMKANNNNNSNNNNNNKNYGVHSSRVSTRVYKLQKKKTKKIYSYDT